jgi:hypothetical protein
MGQKPDFILIRIQVEREDKSERNGKGEVTVRSGQKMVGSGLKLDLGCQWVYVEGTPHPEPIAKGVSSAGRLMREAGVT